MKSILLVACFLLSLVFGRAQRLDWLNADSLKAAIYWASYERNIAVAGDFTFALHIPVVILQLSSSQKDQLQHWTNHQWIAHLQDEKDGFGTWLVLCFLFHIDFAMPYDINATDWLRRFQVVEVVKWADFLPRHQIAWEFEPFSGVCLSVLQQRRMKDRK